VLSFGHDEEDLSFDRESDLAGAGLTSIFAFSVFLTALSYGWATGQQPVRRTALPISWTYRWYRPAVMSR
jgi:hypothetical protein